MKLMDEADVKALIKEYIEETYYSGEANADFRLITGQQIPGLTVAFALKERMSAQQVADLVAGLDPATLADHDLLIFGRPGEGDIMKYRAQIFAFADWIQN